jgi:hypothetical protein
MAAMFFNLLKLPVNADTITQFYFGEPRSWNSGTGTDNMNDMIFAVNWTFYDSVYSNVTLDHLSASFGFFSGAGNITGAVYYQNFSLVGQTISYVNLPVAVATSPTSLNFSSTVTVYNNTVYWLCFWGKDSSYLFLTYTDYAMSNRYFCNVTEAYTGTFPAEISPVDYYTNRAAIITAYYNATSTLTASFVAGSQALGLSSLHPSSGAYASAIGMTFKPSSTMLLTCASLYVGSGSGSPTSDTTGYVAIYALNGTYGVNAKPLGEPLAIAYPLLNAADEITLDNWVFYNFFNPIVLHTETAYGIAIINPSAGTIDGSNAPSVYGTASISDYEGNYFDYRWGAWNITYAGVRGMWFKVYGVSASIDVTLSITDNRIGKGETANISASAVYHGTTENYSYSAITLNDTMIKTTVGKYGYNVTAITPAIEFTSNEVYCIFDKINITSLIAVDSRINLNETASFLITGVYEYDSSTWSGTYTLNNPLTRNAVGKTTYSVSTVTDSLYGLTEYEISNGTASVIFDKLDITLLVTNVSPEQNETVAISWIIKRLYDDTQVNYFQISISKGDNVTWQNNVAASFAYDVETTTISYLYNCSSVIDLTYGLTYFASETASVNWGATGATQTIVFVIVIVGVLVLAFAIAIGGYVAKKKGRR